MKYIYTFMCFKLAQVILSQFFPGSVFPRLQLEVVGKQLLQEWAMVKIPGLKSKKGQVSTSLWNRIRMLPNVTFSEWCRRPTDIDKIHRKGDSK